MLAEASFLAGNQGGTPSQVEVDFYVVPTKTMKLLALAYCTKHGLWQSDEKIVEVE
jgi:superoxide reductase